MAKETVKLLTPAIRPDGYDAKETEKIVDMLLETIAAQSRLLISYRLGSKPPEWVFSTIQKAREKGLEV